MNKIIFTLFLIFIHLTTYPKSGIIGDSNVGVLSSTEEFKNKNVEILYYKVGINSKNLALEVDKFKINYNIDTLYVMVGTNDLYKINSNNLKKLNSNILNKFKKVNKIIYVYGTYGWGGFSKKFDTNNIDKYYTFIKNLNSKNIIVRIPTKLCYYKTSSQAHNNKSEYIKYILKNI